MSEREERVKRAIERGVIPPYLCREDPETLQGERHKTVRPKRGGMEPRSLSITEALRRDSGDSST